MSDIRDTGFLNSAELKELGRYPSEERMSKGPIAVIECSQNIPCNPCETACRFGAITVGDPITNLPVIDESKCVGCGICITKCPGLAIFVVDKSSDGMATVSFPFEYLPLPEKGDSVNAVDRAGAFVCKATVLRVNNAEANDCTPIVTIEIPKEFADEVRSIRRLNLPEKTEDELLEIDDWSSVPDDLIVCRCEEVTVGEIKKAIEEGCITVEAIKKRTRAGMGLCQGRTCSKLVQRIIGQVTGKKPQEIKPDSVRMPIKPVSFGVYKED